MGGGRHDPAAGQRVAGAKSAAVPALPERGLRAPDRQLQPLPRPAVAASRCSRRSIRHWRASAAGTLIRRAAGPVRPALPRTRGCSGGGVGSRTSVRIGARSADPVGEYDHQSTEADPAPNPDRGARSRGHGGRDRRELLHPLRGARPPRSASSAVGGIARLSPLCRDGLLAVPPLPRQMAVRLVAGSVQHFPRRDGAGPVAAGARLCAGRAQHARRLLLRQDHDRALLVPPDVLPRRAADRVSVFPLRAHAPSCDGDRAGRRRWCSAAPPMPRFCCAPSKATRSRRSGRSASCRRRRPTRASGCAAFRCSAGSTISSAWCAISRRAISRWPASSSPPRRSSRASSPKRS